MTVQRIKKNDLLMLDRHLSHIALSLESTSIRVIDAFEKRQADAPAFDSEAFKEEMQGIHKELRRQILLTQKYLRKFYKSKDKDL